jgi:hypothetical protein
VPLRSAAFGFDLARDTDDRAERGARDDPPSVYLASDFGRFRLATAGVHLTGRFFPLMLH